LVQYSAEQQKLIDPMPDNDGAMQAPPILSRLQDQLLHAPVQQFGKISTFSAQGGLEPPCEASSAL
jgi:hypothetical protein